MYKFYKNIIGAGNGICGLILLLISGYFLLFYLPELIAMPLSNNDVAIKILFMLGIPIVLLGMFFWLFSVYLLKRFGGGTPNPFYSSCQKLVCIGTYKYVRHPIYLGFLLLFFGKSLLDNNFTIIIETIILFCALPFIIKIEEHNLKKKYGEEYKLYESRSYRFWPYIY